MLTINASVGKGAPNKDADVMNVLALLQARKNQSGLKAAMETHRDSREKQLRVSSKAF
jgi:hypothetical protein